MKKITCFALCIMAAVTLFSVTACNSTEPSVTGVTAVSNDPGGFGNPWKEASSPEEAAYGANLNDFVIDESVLIDGIAIKPLSYKYTDSVAEASYSLDDVRISVRKSTLEYNPDGDIAGIYHDYGFEWKVDMNGITVNCYGDVKGKASKIIWLNEDLCYSIIVSSQDDAEAGLPDTSVRDLVNAIR